MVARAWGGCVDALAPVPNPNGLDPAPAPAPDSDPDRNPREYHDHHRVDSEAGRVTVGAAPERNAVDGKDDDDDAEGK